jgi:glucose-1-phosphate thymidylyltransferase
MYQERTDGCHFPRRWSRFATSPPDLEQAKAAGQVAGKPMFEHVMDRILPYEPNKVVFITGYRGDEIEQWARSTYPNLDLAFVEQPEMLGQTDAIIRTRDLCSDDALILFPDAIFEADFSILAAADGDGIIFTKVVDDPSSLGVTVVENGFITKLIEKPSEPSRSSYCWDHYYQANRRALRRHRRASASGHQDKGEFFIADASRS